MTTDGLLHVASRPRPTTVGGVIVRMEQIEQEIDARSGVAVFTRLYRWTTEQVEASLAGKRFEDYDGMLALDLAFAGLYFDAVDAWAKGEQLPGAWAPLFDRTDDTGIPPLHFALAGMAAHINRDLAVALVRTSEGPLREDSPQFRDFQAINGVLGQTSDQIRDRILSPDLVKADHALGEIDDQLVMQAITTARRTAWEVAQGLQDVAGVPPAFAAALQVLDTSVGAASRAILDTGKLIGT